MKTSRQRIFEYIQGHRAVTTTELCLALHSTEANIRRHIAILIQQGLVEVVGMRPAGMTVDSPPSANGSRGRPARVYGPASTTLGTNLDLLADALLSELLIGMSDEERQSFFQRAAQHLARNLRNDSSSPPAAASSRNDRLTTRLFHAVQRLNDAHYHARWEARPDAPRLILEHCPYSPLASKHPEVCQMDAHLLEKLIGEPVEQLQRLAKDRRGTLYCLFRVGKREPPDSS